MSTTLRACLLCPLVACSKNPPASLPKPIAVTVAAADAAPPTPVLASEPPASAPGSCKRVATSLVSRYGATGTRLRDGRVLLVGSAVHDAQGPYSAIVEIFDPATHGLTKVAAMPVGRAKHAAVLLADGRVLVAGGMSDEPKTSFGGFSTSAVVYDVAKNVWHRASAIPAGAIGQALAALPDGRAVLAGGDIMYKSAKLAQTLLLDPTTLRWSRLPDAPMSRAGELVPLADGGLLFAGDSAGWSGGQPPGAVVLDPAKRAWSTITGPWPGSSVEQVVAVSANRLAIYGNTDGDGGTTAHLALTDGVLGAAADIPVPAEGVSIFAVDGVLYAQREAEIQRFDEARRRWSKAATVEADGCATRIPLPGGRGRVLYAGRCGDAANGALELCELAP